MIGPTTRKPGQALQLAHVVYVGQLLYAHRDEQRAPATLSN